MRFIWMLGFVVGCGLFSDKPFEGDDAGECSDAADNDRDGLFDCNDPDCAGSPACDVLTGSDDGDTDSPTTQPGSDTDAQDSDVSDSPDVDSESGTDSDLAPQDTAPTVRYLRPTTAIMLASFGYEPTANEATPYTYGTDTLNPGMAFLFANDQWNYTFQDTNNFCSVELSVAGNIPATDLSAFSNVLFGFDLPATADVTTDCNAVLNPTEWPDIGASMLSVDWGVALVTAIDADFATQLQGSMAAEEWDDLSSTNIGGALTGTMASALDQSGLFNGGFGSASAIDESVTDSIVVALDGFGSPEALETTAMVVGGELQRANYTVQVVLPFDFFRQLL